jgi:hypothetical protein
LVLVLLLLLLLSTLPMLTDYYSMNRHMNEQQLDSILLHSKYIHTIQSDPSKFIWIEELIYLWPLWLFYDSFLISFCLEKENKKEILTYKCEHGVHFVCFYFIIIFNNKWIKFSYRINLVPSNIC